MIKVFYTAVSLDGDIESITAGPYLTRGTADRVAAAQEFTMRRLPESYSKNRRVVVASSAQAFDVEPPL